MPFESPFMNKMELLNEICVAMNSFFLLAYSDLVLEPHVSPLYQGVKITDKKTQNDAGWYNTALLGFVLIFNIGIISSTSIRNSIARCKAKYCKKVQKVPIQAKSDAYVTAKTSNIALVQMKKIGSNSNLLKVDQLEDIIEDPKEDIDTVPDKIPLKIPFKTTREYAR